MYRPAGRPVDHRQRSFPSQHDSSRHRGDNRATGDLRNAHVLLLSKHHRVLHVRLDASGVR